MISNPHSGHNRDQFQRIQALLSEHPQIHHIPTHSTQDIEPALREMAAQQIKFLAINGGDGTASAVLGTLVESPIFAKLPQIILLPGGTANMNAGDIGVGGSLEKAMKRFCRWSKDPQSGPNQLAKRSLMSVSIDDQASRYGMFLGAGAVIHGTEYAHKEIHSRGLRDDFSLALGTIRTVWGVVRNDPRFNRHIAIGLRLDEKQSESFDTLILAISTLHRLSFGMRPFWNQEPGAIRLTLFEQGCYRFARTFFSIVRGRPNRHATQANGYRSANADGMTLQLNGKVNLDGEILDVQREVRISSTKALEFIQL